MDLKKITTKIQMNFFFFNIISRKSNIIFDTNVFIYILEAGVLGVLIFGLFKEINTFFKAFENECINIKAKQIEILDYLIAIWKNEIKTKQQKKNISMLEDTSAFNFVDKVEAPSIRSAVIINTIANVKSWIIRKFNYWHASFSPEFKTKLIEKVQTKINKIKEEMIEYSTERKLHNLIEDNKGIYDRIRYWDSKTPVNFNIKGVGVVAEDLYFTKQKKYMIFRDAKYNVVPIDDFCVDGVFYIPDGSVANRQPVYFSSIGYSPEDGVYLTLGTLTGNSYDIQDLEYYGKSLPDCIKDKKSCLFANVLPVKPDIINKLLISASRAKKRELKQTIETYYKENYEPVYKFVQIYAPLALMGFGVRAVSAYGYTYSWEFNQPFWHLINELPIVSQTGVSQTGVSQNFSRPYQNNFNASKFAKAINININIFIAMANNSANNSNIKTLISSFPASSQPNNGAVAIGGSSVSFMAFAFIAALAAGIAVIAVYFCIKS